MTTAMNLDFLAPISAGRLLNCLAEGTVIALFTWILLRVMGRRNSSTRFAVWFSSLLVIGCLPLFGTLTTGSRTGAASARDAAVMISSSWALPMLALWALGAAVALSKVGAGLWHVRKLRDSCVPIDPAILDPLPGKTWREFRSARTVTLCRSERVGVPTAIGFFRPLVVMPAWALEDLSAAELNSILIHELAHLRRWDDWTNLVQKVVRALLFFHPAVWWIEGRLSLEREMACDDEVLDKMTSPRVYAQCLVSVAEKSFLRRGTVLAQAAVSRIRQTAIRVSRILEGNQSHATQVWRPALYGVAAFSIVWITSVAHTPALVAFESTAPTVVNQPALATQALAVLPVASAAAAKSGIPAVALVHSSRPLKVRSTQAGRPRPALGGDFLADALMPPEAGMEPLLMATQGMPGPDDVNAETLVVVMHTGQFHQTGLTRWTICVWRVTVAHPDRPVEARFPAKSI